MKPRFLTLALLLGLTSSSLLAQQNQELGRMWTYENAPLGYLEKEYGFKPDQKWLNSLRMASLRLGGETVTRGFCSASFVSPKGLIMTNNHCVRDAVSATSQSGPQMIKTGFTAASLDKEIRLKTQGDGWLTVSQLERYTKITDRVNAGIADSDNDAAIKKKREANKKEILDETKKNSPKLVPQIVSLYQGGIFMLYQYRVFNDIRLVCTPHLQTAHFGGDPDNFTYPRYSIDFAFIRAYEDGEPADTTKHYFKWKTGGAKAGDLVFVPGNPGSTERLKTRAQMDFMGDIRQPILVERYSSQLRILKQISKRSPRIADMLRTMVLGFENSEKALTGELGGLRDKKLMAQKAEAETAFRKKVAALTAKQFTNLWEDIEKLTDEQRVHEPFSHFHTAGDLSALAAAANIVRAYDPNEPEESRKEFKEGLSELETRDNIITMSFFVNHVARAKKWLAKDDPYFTEVLGGDDGRRVSREWLGSRISSGLKALLEEIEEGGWKAVLESKDPAIVAGRALAPLMRKHELKGEELEAREEALGAKMGLALFETYGKEGNVSPDATMTPRFADGVVKGYKMNGTIAPFRTTFYGLFARNADFDDEYPFNLPQIWLDRRDDIDMTKAVNFVSTNDIVGGNSGSVVVDKELRVVGLIFDGNIESLPNSYVFKDDIPRSVSVHVDGIMESLLKVYNAKRVADELVGK